MRRYALALAKRKPTLVMASTLINLEHSPHRDMITLKVKEIIAPGGMGMIGVK